MYFCGIRTKDFLYFLGNRHLTFFIYYLEIISESHMCRVKIFLSGVKLCPIRLVAL